MTRPADRLPKHGLETEEAGREAPRIAGTFTAVPRPPRLLVRRALAFAFDSAILWGTSIVTLELQTWAEADETGNMGPKGCVLILGFALLYLLYFGLLESRSGVTIGKAAFSLRVETLAGHRPSFGQAMKRHLLDPVDWWLPALLAILLTNPPQRLGDLWARTVVVRDYGEKTRSGF